MGLFGGGRVFRAIRNVFRAAGKGVKDVGEAVMQGTKEVAKGVRIIRKAVKGGSKSKGSRGAKRDASGRFVHRR